jgi:hypothetical protein
MHYDCLLNYNNRNIKLRKPFNTYTHMHTHTCTHTHYTYTHTHTHTTHARMIHYPYITHNIATILLGRVREDHILTNTPLITHKTTRSSTTPLHSLPHSLTPYFFPILDWYVGIMYLMLMKAFLPPCCSINPNVSSIKSPKFSRLN